MTIRRSTKNIIKYRYCYWDIMINILMIAVLTFSMGYVVCSIWK